MGTKGAKLLDTAAHDLKAVCENDPTHATNQ